jgi:hypothetical protein
MDWLLTLYTIFGILESFFFSGCKSWVLLTYTLAINSYSCLYRKKERSINTSKCIIFLITITLRHCSLLFKVWMQVLTVLLIEAVLIIRWCITHFKKTKIEIQYINMD